MAAGGREDCKSPLKYLLLLPVPLFFGLMTEKLKIPLCLMESWHVVWREKQENDSNFDPMLYE